jgi:hypothetical protein
VRLAIDDAGAGFASLRHILQLDADVIKLDMSLTHHIDRERPAALAAGLISFASEIGAAIVAEGIETESELEALRGLGVAFGQGFFLARPGDMPGEHFSAALAGSSDRYPWRRLSLSHPHPGGTMKRLPQAAALCPTISVLVIPLSPRTLRGSPRRRC